MLTALSIRDLLLIDRLEITLAPGLTVLSGETGAGKSILLDALDLALGGRAVGNLVRDGAKTASVTAGFLLPADHSATALLDEAGIEQDPQDGLWLRRVLGAEGRSRAFVNDQPCSLALLRGLSSRLIEIQGQFAQHRLFSRAGHRALLDRDEAVAARGRKTAETHGAWRAAETALEAARAAIAKARREESFLRFSLEELTALAPSAEDFAELGVRRQRSRHRQSLLDALDAAAAALSGDGEGGGAADALGRAQRSLDRIAETAGGLLDRATAAMTLALDQVAEAEAELRQAADSLAEDDADPEALEERFLSYGDLARKHGVAAEELGALQDRFTEELQRIDAGSEEEAALVAKAAETRDAFEAAAAALSRARGKAAKALVAAVEKELPALKLDKARFLVDLAALPREDWGPAGAESVTFAAATNPGTPPGPLDKIASGGELSRFLLAINLALGADGEALSLVFDEVDSGVGGATAAAVGARLKRLAADRQVLCVTHSPQVAALADSHFLVAKSSKRGKTTTAVVPLDETARREEIARMLSGAEVTEEARAAAGRLLGAA